MDNDKQKSVLLVGNHLHSATGQRWTCQDLAERLTNAGWKVITTSSIRIKPLRLLDMVATTWWMRNRYAVAEVDVYSGPSFIWAEAVCAVLKRIKKPYILILHGGNLPEFAKSNDKRVENLLAAAHVVTSPSSYLQEQLQSYRSDILLLPNAVDLKGYDFHLRTQPARKLVWLRSFHEIYNPSLAPKALSLLTDLFPDIHLTMVGADRGDNSLQHTKTVAAEQGVTEYISFPGGIPKEQVPVQLNQGDIFINTTNKDNTPISVIEAMACGLCVVSTNVGGLPYLLEDEHDALLVPPDDPEAMAAAIRRLLTEPGLAEKLSRNGRDKAVGFDWATVLPQWETLFTEVAEKAKV